MGIPAHSVVTVEKPKHTQITVLKASAGSDGRDGRNGYDGRDGIDGRDGEVFVPHVDDKGIISWTKEINPDSAYSINMLAQIDSISNIEILNIVTGE